MSTVNPASHHRAATTGEREATATRLRQLRMERGLAQGEVARRLGISAAYLSLIERGKRAVQLPFLWKALELYGVGLEEFMESLGQHHGEDPLASLLQEPLLRTLNLGQADLRAISLEPRTFTTITTLFNLYKSTRTQLDNLLEGIAAREHADAQEVAPSTLTQAGPPTPKTARPKTAHRKTAHSKTALRFELDPFDEVTEFLEQSENWFPVLEDRANRFRADAQLPQRVHREDLVGALRTQLHIEVEVLPVSKSGSVVRRWSPGQRKVQLAQALGEHRIKFQLAHIIGLQLLNDEQLHDEILKETSFRFTETRALIKIHLANYLAGALLLPYGPFFEEVNRCRHDLDLVASLFESTFETVAHRLCNLSDPKQRGLRFYFMRVDTAGNLSKRYSATALRLPHRTGSCPKGVAHMAFLSPNVLHRSYEGYPDGSTYFAFAKVVTEPKHGSLARGTVYSIGLGTYADNARHLAYADDMPFVDPVQMAVPVGISCRFCERADCNQRAAPSYKFPFRVDANTKKDNFFSPLLPDE